MDTKYNNDTVCQIEMMDTSSNMFEIFYEIL